MSRPVGTDYRDRYPAHMAPLPRDIAIVEHLGPRPEGPAGRLVEIDAVPLPIRDGAQAPVIARAIPDEETR
ncbi:MAG: hypothetical protein AB7F12_25410 [Pseudonocardia sp.]